MELRPKVNAIEWMNQSVVLLDQTKLPHEEVYISHDSVAELIKSIQSLAVRGAPLLGLTGGYGTVLAALESLKTTGSDRKKIFYQLLDDLEKSRPTAVNLKWGIERQKKVFERFDSELTDACIEGLLEEAKKIHLEDIQYNYQIADFGSGILREGKVLTICNTGDLATGGIGTAFGVIAKGYEEKKVRHVYACETRPLLQGLRLTAWELQKNSIPFTMICDSMAALVMRDEKITTVIAGADRIAANGDTANKIGTYQLAVLAKYHGADFIIAAPSSTFDFSIRSGREIPIEQRHSSEILNILDENQHITNPSVYNPAFDVTPHELITAIVCEQGVIRNPNEETMQSFFEYKRCN